MKDKLSKIKVLLYIILSLVLAIVYGVIVNYSTVLPDFFYLDSTKINIENLMYYMWQVQVTIALISISLTSLIVGKLDYKIYGIDIKSILMIKKWWQLNYLEKIIYIIFLSVINMWFIFYSNLPGLTIIFLISIGGILDLIIDSFAVLFTANTYKENIMRDLGNRIKKIEIGDNYKRIYSYLEGIDSHNRDLIRNNDIEKMMDNVKYLFDIIIKVHDSKNNDENIEKLSNHIEKKIIYAVELMSENNYCSFSIKLLDNIIESEVRYENKKYFVEELLETLLSSVKEFIIEKEYKDVSKYYLDELIYKIDYKEYDISDIARIQYNCIYNIYTTTAINDYLKSKIFKYQLAKVLPSSISSLSSEQYLVKQITLNYLIKLLICNLNKEYFSYFFEEFYKLNSLSISVGRAEQVYETIIVVNIYIYYIVKIEELYSNSFKESVYEFIDIKCENDNIKSHSFMSLMSMIQEKIWTYYSSIKEGMPKRGFEYMPSGVVKTLVLENGIENFFLFYTLIFIRTHFYEQIIKKEFGIDLCISVLGHFNNDGTLKKDFEEKFNDFRSLYKVQETSNIKEKIKQFYFLLNRNFAHLTILNEQEYYNDEKVVINKEKIILDVNNKLNTNNFYSKVDKIYNGGHTYLDSLLLDNGVLSEKVYLVGESYQETIVKNIEETIIKVIEKKSVVFKYKYEDTGKIKRLYDMIVSKNMKLDGMVNGELSSDWWLTSNELDEDIELLKKIEEDKKYKYKLGNENSSCILLNNNNKNVVVSIDEFKIEEFGDEEINEFIKENFKFENGYYRVKIVNEIDVLLTLEEIIKYLLFKYKILRVKFTINYEINDKFPTLCLTKIWE